MCLREVNRGRGWAAQTARSESSLVRPIISHPFTRVPTLECRAAAGPRQG